jgi:peptidoglycan/xylan/chitin deacetylase (PgdA/CDA1 family)
MMVAAALTAATACGAIGLAGCGATGAARGTRNPASAHAGGRADLFSRPVPHARGRRRPEVAYVAAIDHLLGRSDYITVGSRRRREVALTFDDGPGPYTPRILAILERSHVPATFFEIGRQVPLFARFTRRALRDGFVIGDHTQAHPPLAALTPAQQLAQIVTAARSIEAAGGPPPRLFRPPYGSFDARTLEIVRRLRLVMVLWSVDTRDWARPGVARIVYTALSGARPGAIILMHDGGGPRLQTVRALPLIIRGLRRRGFRLVSVSRLLADDPPPRRQPRPLEL